QLQDQAGSRAPRRAERAQKLGLGRLPNLTTAETCHRRGAIVAEELELRDLQVQRRLILPPRAAADLGLVRTVVAVTVDEGLEVDLVVGDTPQGHDDRRLLAGAQAGPQAR